jgi:purine-cytosine permease-like protein
MYKWEKYWIALGMITGLSFLLVYFVPNLIEPVSLILVWLVGLLGLVTLVSFIIFLTIRLVQIKGFKKK